MLVRNTLENNILKKILNHKFYAIGKTMESALFGLLEERKERMYSRLYTVVFSCDLIGWRPRTKLPMVFAQTTIPSLSSEEYVMCTMSISIALAITCLPG